MTLASENTLRWGVVVAVPLLALLVGVIALPRPQGLVAEQMAFDRSKLGDAVSQMPTKPRRPLDVVPGVVLGDVVAVRGADLPDVALTRGKRLPVALHLGVNGTVDGDWQVFLHIDAQGGNFRIHGDHWPLRGQYKSGLWRPGEFLIDRWEGTVPMDAPTGIYDVWAGLYRGDERLEITAGDPKVHDGDNRVNVGSITIE